MLTEDQERQVVEMYDRSDVPVDRIAEVFGVSRRTIYYVLQRERERKDAA